MLKGIRDLATIFWQGQRLLDQAFDVADLHLVLLEVFPDLLVNVAGMAQHQVFIFGP